MSVAASIPHEPLAPSLARQSLTLLPFQILFRAGEAALPVLLATWFGRSQATDLFNLVWAFFLLAGSLVFGLFRDSALVPIVIDVRGRQPSALPRVLGSLLAHSLTAAAALAALAGAGVLLWLGHRDPAGDRGLAVALVVPLSAGLVAITARTFFEAVLQAGGWFRTAPVASALGMAVTFGVLAAARGALGVAAIPSALLAGHLAALALLALVAFRGAGVRLRLSFARPEPVRRFARRAASEVAGAAVTRLNPFVDQAMAAASGVVGGGTLLRLSQDVGSLPTTLLQAALLPVLLARLSREMATGRRDAHQRHRRLLVRTVAVAGTALAVACAALLLLGGPLLRLLFLRGTMDREGVDRIVRLLPYHLVGVVPFGILLMLVRAHISMGRSRIMFGMGILNAALNVAFNLLLIPRLGLEGIALGTSLVSVAMAALFAVRLWRAYAARPAP